MAVVAGNDGVTDLDYDEEHGMVVIKCDAKHGTVKKTTLVPLANVSDMTPANGADEAPKRAAKRVSSKPSSD